MQYANKPFKLLEDLFNDQSYFGKVEDSIIF